MRFLPLSFFVSLLLMLSYPLTAQDFIMDGTPIASCTGTFFDPGGAEDYLPGTELSVLICSDDSPQRYLLLRFYEINLAAGDLLLFRDGDHADAPLIDLPVDLQSGKPFSVQASALNTSRCLYVTFQSDENEQAAGWRAAIECTSPCQRIITEMLVNDAPVVQGAPINLCLGDTLTFDAVINFPQNGMIYEQTLDNSSIGWNVGNESYMNIQQVSTVFDDPGYFTASFDVEDDFGCTSNTPPSVEIIVSPGIDLLANQLTDTFCTGEDIILYTSPPAAPQVPGYILAPPLLSDHRFQQIDTLLLPDGNGLVYQPKLTVSGYPVGSNIGTAYSLASFWIDIEHSYSGDLEIELVCPSGQSASILNWPSGLGNIDFGIANITSPPPGGDAFGTPYRYTFRDNGENGKLTDYNPGEEITFPAGDYQPESPFTMFAGCPINGQWTMKITDRIAVDNGSVFGWGLTIDPLNTTGNASIELAALQWGPASIIVSQNQDSVVFDPSETGFYELQLNTTDNFGCLTTAQHTIAYLPGNHPDCLELNTEMPAPIERDNMNPIPFRGYLNYTTSLDCTDCTLAVFNVYGQRMGTYPLQQALRIDTEQWVTGTYFYRVYTARGELLRQAQIIKME